jgi:hypothetical protein
MRYACHERCSNPNKDSNSPTGNYSQKKTSWFNSVIDLSKTVTPLTFISGEAFFLNDIKANGLLVTMESHSKLLTAIRSKNFVDYKFRFERALSEFRHAQMRTVYRGSSYGDKATLGRHVKKHAHLAYKVTANYGVCMRESLKC